MKPGKNDPKYGSSTKPQSTAGKPAGKPGMGPKPAQSTKPAK